MGVGEIREVLFQFMASRACLHTEEVPQAKRKRDGKEKGEEKKTLNYIVNTVQKPGRMNLTH